MKIVDSRDNRNTRHSYETIVNRYNEVGRIKSQFDMLSDELKGQIRAEVENIGGQVLESIRNVLSTAAPDKRIREHSETFNTTHERDNIVGKIPRLQEETFIEIEGHSTNDGEGIDIVRPINEDTECNSLTIEYTKYIKSGGKIVGAFSLESFMDVSSFILAMHVFQPMKSLT